MRRTSCPQRWSRLHRLLRYAPLRADALGAVAVWRRDDVRTTDIVTEMLHPRERFGGDLRISRLIWDRIGLVIPDPWCHRVYRFT